MNLEELNQDLASFPRSNPNPVLSLSADGSVIYYNDAARDLAAAIGADTPASILPSDTAALITLCLGSGEKIMNLLANVRRRTISWSFIPILETKVVHGYATDITDRLNLEAQLRHSVKMEAVGQLAAGVAHDFNNILTIIQGHADLVSQLPGLPAAGGKSAEQIGIAAGRASQLIKQLLLFSR